MITCCHRRYDNLGSHLQVQQRLLKRRALPSNGTEDHIKDILSHRISLVAARDVVSAVMSTLAAVCHYLLCASYAAKHSTEILFVCQGATVYGETLHIAQAEAPTILEYYKAVAAALNEYPSAATEPRSDGDATQPYVVELDAEEEVGVHRKLLAISIDLHSMCLANSCVSRASSENIIGIFFRMQAFRHSLHIVVCWCSLFFHRLMSGRSRLKRHCGCLDRTGGRRLRCANGLQRR